MIGAYEFQPSPGAMAGCDTEPSSAAIWRTHSFNPHPARWPGATVAKVFNLLTTVWFQPSPGAMAGCDCLLITFGALGNCFNPHPARWPGATSAPSRCGYYSRRVSTLTRRDGRVRPRAQAAVARPRVFQPSPGAMAGCDTSYSWPTTWRSPCFNPHPARWPGATARSALSVTYRPEFQPSPGAMAGCDLHLRPLLRLGVRVSTLTRRDGRVRHFSIRLLACA